ncbi:MAG: ABC transporter permease [Planctomycetota bacterium]|nr:ABC transporter permease [Planctomycetota bacterium]
MTEPSPIRTREGARFGSVVREGLLYVVRHPLRSALTALTSAVAIAVTVNVISLSYGLDEDVRRDVARFGRLTIDVGRLPVIASGVERPHLGDDAVARVRDRTADLDAVVVPRRQVSGRATGAATLERIQVVGAPPTYLSTLGVEVVAGRWLETVDGDGRDAPGACALDAEAARQLFPDVALEDVIGRTIQLRVQDLDQTMTVVGVLEDPLTYRALFETFDEGRGARTLTSSLLSFRNVYVRETTIAGDEYTGISIALPDEARIETARDRLAQIWPNAMKDGQPVFLSGLGVFVRKDWMDALGASTATGAMLGNIIWIIIVLVAVIMISTLNLITIRERYDDLAVRRCEGATRHDVALQITVEGVVTSVLGGLAGLPLGYAGAAVLRDIVDFPFRFDPAYAGIATLIAAVLGLFSSVVPARRAARLQPATVLSRRLT